MTAPYTKVPCKHCRGKDLVDVFQCPECNGEGFKMKRKSEITQGAKPTLWFMLWFSIWQALLTAILVKWFTS